MVRDWESVWTERGGGGEGEGRLVREREEKGEKQTGTGLFRCRFLGRCVGRSRKEDRR